MKRDKEIKILLTETEKDYLKAISGDSNLSKYVRSKVLPTCRSADIWGQSEIEEKDEYKKVPKINHSFYVELFEISSELERLENEGKHLKSDDRTCIARVRQKIARLGLKAIGLSTEHKKSSK